MDNNRPNVKKAAKFAYMSIFTLVILIGTTFGLKLSTAIILEIIGIVVGNVVFSKGNNKPQVKLETKGNNTKALLSDAKKMNANILNMINRVEDDGLKQNIREIYQTANKIITTVANDNKKIRNVENFFTYYLPETLQLLKKYDAIENQKLGNASDEFMKKTQDMVVKINEAFKKQLEQLYQDDIIDTSADIKVFDTMIKSDGYGESDFKF